MNLERLSVNVCDKCFAGNLPENSNKKVIFPVATHPVSVCSFRELLSNPQQTDKILPVASPTS
jgi:hypothetical protein